MTPSTSGQNALSLAGRALIALLFVPEGFGKITGFAGTVRYSVAAGVPMPEVAVAIAIAVELGLGLLLLAGFRTRWAALGMAVYVIVITFVFHHYWDMPAAQVMMQRINFYKNFAIAGGLLSIAAWGPGAWSVDGSRGKR